MDLYKLNNNKLESLDKKSFDLERDIQSLLENNTESLFNLDFISTEFTIGQFRLDSLCFDNETKSFVIIEYKKGSSYSVIDQGYSYLSVMLNNKSDFILEYNENTDKSLKRSDIDWSQSRILFISPSFNSYQKNSVNFKDVPFELWEISKFSKELISLNRHLPTSKESIQDFGGSSNNSFISSVNKEVKVYNDSDLLKKCNDKTLKSWEDFQLKLNELDDVNYLTRKHYIGVRRNNKTITFVHFHSTKLVLYFLRGNEYDNKKSRGFFTFDDPKNLSKKGEDRFKDGTVRKFYEIYLLDMDNIDYVMMLIKQKYNSFSN
tara:strand:- start:355 stop:1311 length:957 start_codon:yes stop_codon:yes gene_type:complete